MRFRFAIAVLAGLGVAAAARAAPADDAADPGTRRQVVLAITSQLRGSVSSRIGDPDRSPGGLAHLAVLIRRARQAFPGLVLLDAGNALAGAADALLPVEENGAPPILAAMNRLRYDAAIPAERDLDRSERALVLAMEASEFPWLGANLSAGGAIQHGSDNALRAFTVVERGGVRIALVGLVSPGILLGKEPEFRERLRIADAEEAALRVAAQIGAEATADLVIAIGAGSAADDAEREAGLLEDLARPNAAGVIADRTPGLDLIISGRGRLPRNDAVARPNRSYRAPLIEPVPSSRALTLVVLDVERSGDRWRVTNVTQETQWAGEAADADILAATADALEKTRRSLAVRLPVYVAGRAVKRTFQACAGALGHAAALKAGGRQLRAAGPLAALDAPQGEDSAQPELSLLPSLWRTPRWSGREVGRQLTRGDVLRWIGQDDPLVVAQLTGRQIALLLEPYVRQMHGWRIPASQVLFPGGLDVTLAPGRSEAVSVRQAETSEPLRDARSYALWITRYHRFGGGGLAARASIQANQPTRILPLTLREAVLEYLTDAAAHLPAACASLLRREPPAPKRHKQRLRAARPTTAPDLAQRSLRTASGSW